MLTELPTDRITPGDFRDRLNIFADAYEKLFSELQAYPCLRPPDSDRTETKSMRKTNKGHTYVLQVRDAFAFEAPEPEKQDSFYSDDDGDDSLPQPCQLEDLPNVANSSKDSLKMTMEYLLLLILLIDFTYMPIMVAWNAPDTGAFLVYLSFAIIVWTADIVVQLRRYPRSKNSTYRTSVAMMLAFVTKYRAKLSFSVAMVLADVLLLILISNESAQGSAIRCLCLVRLLRLLRAWSVQAYSSSLESRWPFSSLCLRLLMIVVSILHIVSCLWYVLGAEIASDTGASWLALPQFSQADGALEDGGRHYQYLTSLEFAVSLMSPAGSNIRPQNSAEKIVAIMITLMDVFIVSLVTSQLSAKFVRVQASKREQLDREDRLNRFFIAQRVPWKLATQVRSAI